MVSNKQDEEENERNESVKHKEEYNPKIEKPRVLPLGDTINILMDINSEEKVIQVGKCLDEDEQKDHATLLRDFPKLFSWPYSDMLGIDAKIVTHNIVLAKDDKPMRQKIRNSSRLKLRNFLTLDLSELLIFLHGSQISS